MQVTVWRGPLAVGPGFITRLELTWSPFFLEGYLPQPRYRGEILPWFCLKVVCPTLLTPHGSLTLSEEWIGGGSWVKVGETGNGRKWELGLVCKISNKNK